MPENPIVYVVDDDEGIRKSLASLIQSVGLKVETFESAQDFLEAEKISAPGCLILDVRLRGLSGLDLQSELVRAEIHTPIVFITGHGDIPMSVRAIKAGAVEFLPSPSAIRICWTRSGKQFSVTKCGGRSAAKSRRFEDESARSLPAKKK